MEFERESFNDGITIFKSYFSDILSEIESVLGDTDYHFNHTFEENRENELVFDPVGMNRALGKQFANEGWKTEVKLEESDSGSGNAIDISKGNIAGEIQFGNFAYLGSDCNRLQRLYEGTLRIESGNEIEAGIIIVVKRDMPTSQSVSHFQQAIGRAAPQTLVRKYTCPECSTEMSVGMPALIYGIEPPEEGDAVYFNTYEAPRSRTRIDQEEIGFKKKHISDNEQSEVEDF